MNMYTVDDVDLHVEEQGTGRPVVVLHGGGGPITVTPVVQHIAATAHAYAPTLPGWNGTIRPDSLARVEDIAALLSRWLEVADLRDVTIIGSSIGGWIAGELAVRDRGVGRITGVVLIDAVGFDVPDQPIRDFFALDARGVAQYSWHDSERFYVDPGMMPDAHKAVMAANMATMRAVAGDPYMIDPALLGRVGAVELPALVIWGDSDGIVSPQYGREVAAAFGAGHFELVANAGHLPHLEQPAATLALIDRYLTR